MKSRKKESEKSLHKNDLSEKRKNNKMKHSFTLRPRGIIALGILLYILFGLTVVLNSNWTYAVKQELITDASYTQLEDPFNYFGPGIYTLPLGERKEGQNYVLFWEGPENYARIGDIEAYPGNLSDILPSLLAYLRDSEYFSVYGKSCIGILNMEPFGEDHQPGIVAKIDSFGYEIKYVSLLPDLNGDGIEEIFISRALLQAPLPELDENITYYDYFMEHPRDFFVYYNVYLLQNMTTYSSYDETTGEENIARISQSVAVIPKYKGYENTILYGNNLSRYKTTYGWTPKFGNQSVIETVLLGNDTRENWYGIDLEDSFPDFAVLESSLDTSLYKLEKIRQLDYGPYGLSNLTWTDRITTYHLINGTQIWSFNSTTMENYTLTYYKGEDYTREGKSPYPFRPESLMDPDYWEIANNFSVSLGERGFRHIFSLGKGLGISLYAVNSFLYPMENSFVFNATNGDFLWSRKGSLFVGIKDFDNDGLFDVGQFQIFYNQSFLTPSQNYERINQYLEAYSNGSLSLSENDTLKIPSLYSSQKITLLDSKTGETKAIYQFPVSEDSPFTFNYYYHSHVYETYPGLRSVLFSPYDLNHDSIADLVAYSLTSIKPSNVLRFLTSEQKEFLGIFDDVSVEEIESLLVSHHYYGVHSVRIVLNETYGAMKTSVPYPGYVTIDAFSRNSPESISFAYDQGSIEYLDADIEGDGHNDYIAGDDPLFDDTYMFLILDNVSTPSSSYSLLPYFWIQHSYLDRINSFGNINEESMSWYYEHKRDWRSLSHKIIIYNDFREEERVSAIVPNMQTIYLYEDIRLPYDSDNPERFSRFFPNFSGPFTWGSIALSILMVLLLLSGIDTPSKQRRRRERKLKRLNKRKAKNKIIMPHEDPRVEEYFLSLTQENSRKLNRVTKFLAFLLFLSLIYVEVFLLFGVRVEVEFSSGYIGPQASILWFILIYPIVFPLFVILPYLYTRMAPYFAEKTYLRLQERFYKSRIKAGMIDYRILVTEIPEHKKVSVFTYINRALLPILISFTIGITIYKGLAPGGFLYTFIYFFNPSFYPLTHPEYLGLVSEDLPFDRIWVELGRFALFCIFPMILTYFATALLIPSSWVLDDTGVVYYINHLTVRGVDDVESVSNWLLNFISGFFGMSAIVAFLTLFQPLFAQIGELENALSENVETFSPTWGVIAFIILTVGFALLMGFALMVACIAKTEEELYILIDKLLYRLEKKGIDTTPVDVAAILSANVGNKPWTEGLRDEITGNERAPTLTRILSRKQKRLVETEIQYKENEIKQELIFIPERLVKLDFEEALNILKSKIVEAYQYGLHDLMDKLYSIKDIINGLKSIADKIMKFRQITIQEVSEALERSEEEVRKLFDHVKISIPVFSIEYNILKFDASRDPSLSSEATADEATTNEILKKSLTTLINTWYLLLLQENEEDLVSSS